MNKLRYEKPAKKWNEALPIGNGKTGVMVFGGKTKDTLCFNDSTLWSGYPKNQDSPESFEYLQNVRDMIFKGNYSAAESLAAEHLTGAYSEGYWPLGNLEFKFKKINKKDYARILNLEDAIHAVSAKDIRRECFASYPDKIVCYSINSVKPFSFLMSASGNKVHNIFTDGDTINIVGNAPDYVAPNYDRLNFKPIVYSEMQGMCYALRAKIVTDGTVEVSAKSISVKQATKLNIFVATATGFKGFNEMPDTDTEFALHKCMEILENAGIDYAAIKERHIADYQAIYSRNVFSLNEKISDLTSKMVKIADKYTVENNLIELMYNYGKYMTIAGSRKGGQPLNLQGIWNKDKRPAWSSNYTTNINAEMNYWGATNSNLSECIAPFIDMVYEIMQHGKSTAEVNYGCRGFCCNHNVDIWRKTAPVKGSPSYSIAPLCGVWLANEVYTHYKTAKLTEYEAKVKEIIENAALFANDYLVLYDDKYVTCPSSSPEASFKANGKTATLGVASAFDMGIIKQVFNNYLECGTNISLTEEINAKLPMLHPFTAGVNGIEEWKGDLPITESGHRHFSPLYAFYPANVINYYGNPEELQMIIDLYKYRLDYAKGQIGWSDAWALCIAGRMHSSNKALDIIRNFLKHNISINLFGVHKPKIFQIDANFGYVAGINSMLVYSQDDYIELLPAVPKEWPEGEVKGFVVNGIEISFKWLKGYVYDLSANQPINVKDYRLASNCVTNENITIIK